MQHTSRGGCGGAVDLSGLGVAIGEDVQALIPSQRELHRHGAPCLDDVHGWEVVHGPKEAAEGVRCRGLHQFEGPRVAGLTLGALHAPLIGVGWRAGAFADQINRRASGTEGYGVGRTSVVLQAVRIEEGVGSGERAGGPAEGAGVGVFDVEAAVGECSHAYAIPYQASVIGHDGVAQYRPTTIVDCASRRGAVAREGGVGNLQLAAVVDATAELGSGVTGEGGVGNRERATAVVDTAAICK